MKFTETSGASVREMHRLKRLHFFFAALGLAGLGVTYLLASSDLENNVKLVGAIGIATVFLLFCFMSYRLQRRSVSPDEIDPSAESDRIIAEALESKLLALDEANRFFGSSLKPSDMFRLISSRVADIFPIAASVLFLVDEHSTRLVITQADGRNSGGRPNVEIGIGEGVAGRAVSSRSLEFTDAIAEEGRLTPAASVEGFRSAVAIPLFQEDELFGVFQLYTDSVIVPDKLTKHLLESIGERVAPIFRNSIAFEQSLSNALTDPLTSLPNERAFFMILENQLAESQRYRDDRPLTVLAIDIKDFAEANLSFGHSTGDRVLNFVADLVKSELRKMDFLARSVNDEFVVILPTANEKTALEIVERIKTSFVANPFEISDREKIKIWLNFGWATFWQDGETAQQLLQNAQLRKQQSKSAEPSKVLWFPKEYVN